MSVRARASELLAKREALASMPTRRSLRRAVGFPAAGRDGDAHARQREQALDEALGTGDLAERGRVVGEIGAHETDEAPLDARGELGAIAVERRLAQHLLEDAAVADVLVLVPVVD